METYVCVVRNGVEIARAHVKHGVRNREQVLAGSSTLIRLPSGRTFATAVVLTLDGIGTAR
jgi:hypothetical protein